MALSFDDLPSVTTAPPPRGRLTFDDLPDASAKPNLRHRVGNVVFGPARAVQSAVSRTITPPLQATATALAPLQRVAKTAPLSASLPGLVASQRPEQLAEMAGAGVGGFLDPVVLLTGGIGRLPLAARTAIGALLGGGGMALQGERVDPLAVALGGPLEDAVKACGHKRQPCLIESAPVALGGHPPSPFVVAQDAGSQARNFCFNDLFAWFGGPFFK